MSKRKTSKESRKHISSQASGAGRLPSDSQDGPKTKKSGLAPAPASPSPSPASLRDWATSGTYGPLFVGLSPSAVLQSCLENRLRARMDVNGSLEYALTWKIWDMPSGPPICALQASVRHRDGSGFSGWPTPRTGGHGVAGCGKRYKSRIEQAAVLASGIALSEYRMDKHGVLNPEHARWLMGFPPTWGACAPMVTRSSRRSRQSS